MSLPPKSHEEFVKFLHHADLQQGYEEAVKRIARRVKRKIRSEKEELIRELGRALEDDDEHRRVLNACIYPFAQGQIPGYYFVRAAPLSELEHVENLDFLIVCAEPGDGETPLAIVGEAKGSVNDPERHVAETKDRIVVFENNWQYARDQYFRGQELLREFVLGVLSSDANEISKSVVRKQGGIIVWSVDWSNDPIISLHRPDLSRSDSEVRETMFHKNRSLNVILDKLATSQSFKMFYEQSHQVAKLRVLTAVDKGKEEAIFSLDDVRTLVREALDYISDTQIIEKESQRILYWGVEIGFVRDLGSDKYQIKTRSKRAESRASEIERMWIANRLKELQKQRIDNEIAQIQPEFEKERMKRPTLEEIASQQP